MASTGMLVVQWPLVLGCDAAGVVVKAGAKANSPLGPLKVGDEVFGCTRLGDAPYATCQEYACPLHLHSLRSALTSRCSFSWTPP